MSRYWRPFTADPVSSNKFGTTMLDIENSFANSIGKGVLSGCTMTSLGGLSLNVAAGRAFYAGGYVAVAGKVLSLVNNTTNHIYCVTTYNSSTRYFDPDIISNTTGSDPTNSLKLGTVITSGGNISTINTTGEYPLITLEDISDRIGNGTLVGGITALPTGTVNGRIPVIGVGNYLPLSIVDLRPLTLNSSSGYVGINNSAPTGTLEITNKAGNTSSVNLSLKGIISQTGNYLNILNDSGTNLLNVNSSGKLTLNYGITSPIKSGTRIEAFGDSILMPTGLSDITVLGNSINLGSTLDVSKSVVIGNLNTLTPGTSAIQSVLIGYGLASTNNSNILIGTSISGTVNAFTCISIGHNSSIRSQSIFMGYNTINSASSDSQIIGIGQLCSFAGNNSLTIGCQAISTSGAVRGVGLGFAAVIQGSNAIGIGTGSQAASGSSIAIGNFAFSVATSGVAIGSYARSYSPNGIAIGNNISLTTTSSAITTTPVLIGTNCTTPTDHFGTTIVGSNTVTDYSHLALFGHGNIVTNTATPSISNATVIFGSGNTDIGQGSGIIVGYGNSVPTGNTTTAVVIGKSGSASNDSISIGIGGVQVTGIGSIGIGQNSVITGDGSYSLGRNTLLHASCLAFGSINTSTATGQIIFGTNYKTLYFGAGITDAGTILTCLDGAGAVTGNTGVSSAGFQIFSTSATNTGRPNVQGMDLVFRPGYGSGNAKSGDLSVYLGGVASTSGIGLNSTYTERFRLRADAGAEFTQPAAAGADILTCKYIATTQLRVNGNGYTYPRRGFILATNAYIHDNGNDLQISKNGYSAVDFGGNSVNNIYGVRFYGTTNCTQGFMFLNVSTYDSKGLVIKMASGAIANGFELQNTSGTVLTKITNTGVIQAAGYNASSGNSGGSNTTGGLVFENGLYISGTAISTGSVSAFSWNNVTGTSAVMVTNAGYVANNASLVTLTLPATGSFGNTIEVVGEGAGGWLVNYGAGTAIKFGSSTSTTTSGSLASTDANDSIRLLCISSTSWKVISSIGNIDIN